MRMAGREICNDRQVPTFSFGSVSESVGDKGNDQYCKLGVEAWSVMLSDKFEWVGEVRVQSWARDVVVNVATRRWRYDQYRCAGISRLPVTANLEPYTPAVAVWPRGRIGSREK
ncbi:MAG: hypothetical protein ACLUD2_03935 [Clostridium sp.]